MEIRDRIERVETTAAALDFYSLARIEALSKGRRLDAQRIADEQATTQRVQRVQEKADPGAIGGSSPQWGQELAGDFRQLATGFVAELAHIGAFDAALADMVQQPLRTRIAVSVTAVAGSEVDEGADKVISQLGFRRATEMDQLYERARTNGLAAGINPDSPELNKFIAAQLFATLPLIDAQRDAQAKPTLHVVKE